MPFYRITTAFLSFFLITHLIYGQAIPGASKSLLIIDSLIQKRCANFVREFPFSALSVGIVHKGKTYFYNFGTIQLKQAQQPTSSTVYEIGSITKTFTGTLLAQAAIEGKVKLEDDIRLYMADKYPNLEYQGQPIRLVHLLNHSSGLPFDLPLKPSRFYTLQDSTAFEQQRLTYTPKDFLADLHHVKLDTVPGIKLSYSNSAAQLLGYILERVYKKTYEELVHIYISYPLRMAHTQTQISKARPLRGYNGTGKSMPYFLNQGVAAGGIYSTAADLLRYAQWHMDESNPVIKLTHQPTWGDIRYYAIGLNWQMDDRTPNPRRIFQSGGTAGFSSCLLIHPEQKRGIVLLSNVSDQNTQGQLSSIANEALLLLEQ